MAHPSLIFNLFSISLGKEGGYNFVCMSLGQETSIPGVSRVRRGVFETRRVAYKVVHSCRFCLFKVGVSGRRQVSWSCLLVLDNGRLTAERCAGGW
jgi:hypothetical protein